MKFYDALQMDPAILKRKIAACETKGEKAYYWAAMAVALFCMMLGIRFVNFEYCIGDSLVTLAAVLGILVLVPAAASVLPPVFLVPLHFAAFLPCCI